MLLFALFPLITSITSVQASDLPMQIDIQYADAQFQHAGSGIAVEKIYHQIFTDLFDQNQIQESKDASLKLTLIEQVETKRFSDPAKKHSTPWDCSESIVSWTIQLKKPDASEQTEQLSETDSSECGRIGSAELKVYRKVGKKLQTRLAKILEGMK